MALIPLLILICSFYRSQDQWLHSAVMYHYSGQRVKKSQGVGASISLLFYPLGIAKISLEVEGSLCYIQGLLMKVTAILIQILNCLQFQAVFILPTKG